MSGCWSYFVEMYCRMDVDSEICVDFRNGSDRMLELYGVSTNCTKSQTSANIRSRHRGSMCMC